MERGYEVVGVVTRPDRPQGRSQNVQPSAVKKLVIEKWPDLPVFTPEKASTEEFADTLKKLNADLFLVVAYGEILRKNILEIPPKSCVNIHASLLPKYRGAAPIQRCIMEGDKETGITMIEMVLKMDAGPMLAQEKILLDEDTTFGELEERLCQLSCDMLPDLLKKIEEDRIVKISQEESHVTFAPKIVLEDRTIDFKKSATVLHNQIRALSPAPGAFCFVESGGQVKRLLLYKTKKIVEKSAKEPGATVTYDKKEWVIACGENSLSILELQIEGKKRLSIEEFLRGNPYPPKVC